MKYLFVLPFILFSFSSLAQQKGVNVFSISYGHGNGQIRPIFAKIRTTGLESKGPVNVVGLNYYGGIGKHSYIETGLSFISHRYTFTNFDVPSTPTFTAESYNAFFIPLKLRFDILKYLFISGGISVDVNVKGGSSFGAGIGAGVQYYYKNKYGFFIYPQLNVYDLGPGLLERNISFGLAYKLDRN